MNAVAQAGRPLAGKVALVTGASSGIGEATAYALADAGATVAIGARRRDRLESVAERLRAGGGDALTLSLDVDDERSCREAAERTRSELGGPDILVNNAGVMLLGPIVGADTEDWRRMISTNVLGLMYMTHAVISAMADRGTGHIVNISSIAGRVARSGAGVYNASKWAVTAFSESLRQEVTERGVRVTLIEPGAAATELSDHITHEQSRRESKEFYGQIRVLDADDVARAVVYAVTQPAHVAINTLMLRPTDQVR